MNWYPQALLTAEQACRSFFLFLLEKGAPLLKMTVSLYIYCFLVNDPSLTKECTFTICIGFTYF